MKIILFREMFLPLKKQNIPIPEERSFKQNIY